MSFSPMKKYYVSKNYADKFTASSKAKIDCEIIAEKSGYINIGLPRKIISNKFLGRVYTILSDVFALIRMPKDSLIFLQFPVSCYTYLLKRACKRGNKVITIIHDLDILRGFSDVTDFSCLERSDVVIVHTESMKEWCEKNLHLKSVIVLDIFDYLYDFDFKPTANKHKDGLIRIAFAGNLSKSEFIDQLELSEKIEYRLFGIGLNHRSIYSGNVKYVGSFPADSLWEKLDSDFGLVWDGNSLLGCSGKYGQYLKYISPHKLSLYISCGLPVIVWNKSAMSDFVRKNNIGLSISSISDLEAIIDNPEFLISYNEYLENIKIVRDNIVSGYYLRNALESAEEQL